MGDQHGLNTGRCHDAHRMPAPIAHSRLFCALQTRFAAPGHSISEANACRGMGSSAVLCGAGLLAPPPKCATYRVQPQTSLISELTGLQT